MPIIGTISSSYYDAGGSASGQQLFTSTGTFTVPSGVTSISAVCVGGGGGGTYSGSADRGGGGGGLRYITTLAVTPGESLSVVVGSGGITGSALATSGGNSSISRGATVLLEAGGGTGGYNGTGASGASGGTGSTIAGVIGGGNGGSS